MEINRRDAIKAAGVTAASAMLPVPLITSKSEVQAVAATEAIDYRRKIYPTFAEYKAKAMEVLVENQRQVNPKLIPDLVKIFEDSNIWDWVSVQPIPLDNDIEAFYVDISPHEKEENTYTVQFKTKKCEARTLDAPIFLSIDRLEYEVFNELSNNVGKTVELDFNHLDGDTIKQKWESIYVEMIHESHEIAKKIASGGGNRIITSPEISSLFETVATHSEWMPLSNKRFDKTGYLCKRWNLYKDMLCGVLDKNPSRLSEILLFNYSEKHNANGCVFMPLYMNNDFIKYGLTVTNPNYYTKIKIANFIL